MADPDAAPNGTWLGLLQKGTDGGGGGDSGSGQGQ